MLAPGLEAIEGAADRMAALIEERIDAAHLAAGWGLELCLDPVNLIALVEAAVEEARRGASGRLIRFEAEAVELVGTWDPVRLTRVLANLLENAVKYSPPTSEVVVRVGQDVTPAGTWAIVAVRDDGMGIPATDLPRLFERFYRATNVAGRPHGTGIGLAGARQIFEQHGGTIVVESEEGQGSTFTVRLPLSSADPPLDIGGYGDDIPVMDVIGPIAASNLSREGDQCLMNAECAPRLVCRVFSCVVG